MVVSKRNGEEQVELSRDYVGNLIKNAEKKAQKRKLKEEEEEEEDNDEGVSFYESKRSKTIIEDEDEEAFHLDDNQSLDLSVLISLAFSLGIHSTADSTASETRGTRKSPAISMPAAIRNLEIRGLLLCLLSFSCSGDLTLC